MKIKQELRQFAKENVLIAVAGDKRAKFYSAGDGTINLAGEIEIKISKYEDNEGFFGGKKGGIASRSGRPSTEANKESSRQKFVQLFLKKIIEEEKKKKLTSIFIFAPLYMHSLLEEALPKNLAKKIKAAIAGNQIHSTPFELLKKISQKIGGEIIINEKARKLLKK